MSLLASWHHRISPAAARQAASRRIQGLRTDVENAVVAQHAIAGQRAILDLREDWLARDVEAAKAELTRMGG
jgi:hypothetical protein